MGAAYTMAVIKYKCNDTEYIIRPFGQSEMNETKVSIQQIHSKPKTTLSLIELKQCIRSIKEEAQNKNQERYNRQRELCQDALSE